MDITAPFLTLLNFLSQTLGGSVGWAIVAATLLIRSLLLPIILPSLKSNKKIQELNPQLQKLKAKYGSDRETFAKKQMELYKENGVNPLGGCLPQLVQLGLFLVFYQVLNRSLSDESLLQGARDFLWFNVTRSDTSFILPFLAGVSQLLLGVMLLPATSTVAEKKLAGKTTKTVDDQNAMDMDSMAKTMQSQMVFVLPVITVFAALRFPSGLALYWVVSTLFSLVQQYMISGLGGLRPYFIKLRLIKE